MPASILASPFVVWFLAALYFTWTHDGDHAFWIAPPLVALTVTFVMAPQINWWWWKRNPPDLSPSLTKLFEKQLLFYQKLSEEAQKRFRTRVFLFMQANQFLAKGFPDDELPDDLKAMIAAAAVQLSLHRAEFLMPRFETIVVYRQAFPSPAYPFFHASEIEETDGGLLFSAEHVIKSFIQPVQYFNVALYEYARVFQKTWPNESFPNFLETDWPALETVAQMPRAAIEASIGLPQIDWLAVGVHHFFTQNERFRLVFPEKSAAFDRIFNPASLF